MMPSRIARVRRLRAESGRDNRRDRSKSDGCQGLVDSSLRSNSQHNAQKDSGRGVLPFTKTNFMSRIPNAQHLRRRTRANLGASATAIIQRWKSLQFKPGALDDPYRRSTTLVLEHFAKKAGSGCRCEPPRRLGSSALFSTSSSGAVFRSVCARRISQSIRALTFCMKHANQ